MIAVLAVLFAIAQSTAEKVGLDSWLPNNLVGLLTALSVAGLLIDRVKNRGKKEGVDEQTVNGIGTRVGAVERKYEQLDGRFQEHQRSVDRVLGQNDSLLREIGKAEHGAEQCRQDMEKYTIEVGSKVDTMRRDIMGALDVTRRELGDRTSKIEIGLAEVKREVELRAEFDNRENRERPR